MSPQPRRRAPAPPVEEPLDVELAPDGQPLALEDTPEEEAAPDRARLLAMIEELDGALALAREHKDNSERLLEQANARIDLLESSEGAVVRLDAVVGLAVVDDLELRQGRAAGALVAGRAGAALERTGRATSTDSRDLIILAVDGDVRELLVEGIGLLADVRTT